MDYTDLPVYAENMVQSNELKKTPDIDVIYSPGNSLLSDIIFVFFIHVMNIFNKKDAPGSEGIKCKIFRQYFNP